VENPGLLKKPGFLGDTCREHMEEIREQLARLNEKITVMRRRL
jgi:hypothetical protein